MKTFRAYEVRSSIIIAAFLCGSYFTVPVFAETTLSTTVLSAGRYSASVLPSFNRDMGDRLEKSLKTIPGIRKVVTRVEDSTIHFTVEDRAQVPWAKIQKRVAETEAGAVISNPMLEPAVLPSAGQ